MGLARKRQLIALMFSDVVGYGSITTKNEALAVELVDEYRSIFRRCLEVYSGRENKTMGDGIFAEFDSALDAVRCAIAVQTSLYERNLVVPRERQLVVRIGIHLGDVVRSEGDSFGEGVNIAARIEGCAAPGGICVSQQVADLIVACPDLVLERVGRRLLKHVRSAAVLYRVVLPWEKRSPAWSLRKRSEREPETELERNMPRAERWRDSLLTAILTCAFVLLAYLGARFLYDYRNYDLARASEVRESRIRVPLEDGWQYANAPFDQALGVAGRGRFLYWKPIQRPYWEDANQLSSPYWLLKVFEADRNFRNPCIVLGIIPGAHRVYLNGKFIGGSNHSFSVAYYGFDPSLLNPDGVNYLVVKVNPHIDFAAGIQAYLVGSFLGEFNSVYGRVVAAEYRSMVLYSLYLAVALMGFLASFIFCLFNWNEKHYLYFALYLLLESMSLLHASGLIAGFLDFHVHRAVHLFGLSLSSMVLLSFYARLRGATRWEVLNNALAVIWAVSLAGLLLLPGINAGSYLVRWNLVLSVTALYTVVWVSGLFYCRVIRLLQEGSRWKSQLREVRVEAVILWFGALTALFAMTQIKTHSALFPWALRHYSYLIGNLFPFLIAGMVLVAGLLDYVLKHRSILSRQRADNLLLSIAEIIRVAPRSGAVVPVIQTRVSEFIAARRSTLYLFESANGCLRSHCLFGPPETRAYVADRVREGEGILGYVCANRAPLLIGDVTTDVRFRQHVAARRGLGDTFRTGSCMLFPLLSEDRLIGVLTVADKRRGGSFTKNDFALLHLVAKDLALLLRPPSQNLSLRPQQDGLLG